MKIDPKQHEWMTSEGVEAIFAALPKDSIRFVGGCVRNAIMGEPVGDIDMATKIAPNKVQALLKKVNIKTIPTGIDHGTIMAVFNGTSYEITTLRKDVETDGRRAVIAFTKDWAEDAVRRDFTVNALYADIDGQVYDPTELGLKDIKARKFRFVGDANARVQEDYLRILRYFRFLAWYSVESKVDATALRACRENKLGLKQLSSERIWSEIKKILSAPNPGRVLQIMLTNEILNIILPEASNVEGFRRIKDLEHRKTIALDPLLRLMAMSARDEIALARMAKRLKLSKSEKTRLQAWAGNHVSFTLDMDEKSFKQGIYASGSLTVYDRLIIRAAGEDDPLLSAEWVRKANFARDWKIPVFPLQGKDLQAVGIKAGPEMGRILRALEELWIRSGFKADTSKLLMAVELMKLGKS